MKIARLLSIFLFPFLAAFAAEKPLFKITVQLDWVAEPEHGGFYQAQARGFFRPDKPVRLSLDRPILNRKPLSPLQELRCPRNGAS